MDPQPNQIDQIFHEASQIESAAERSDYLERACGDDADLRGRVDRLLAAQSKVGSFLESPAPGAELGGDASELIEAAGAKDDPRRRTHVEAGKGRVGHGAGDWGGD